ncbi:MAG: glycoside hydrolase family 31 protein [Lachnospiraceae bacterium]|nr:glycoside hydrolase family 31 protein [Lachnospiraceae bacterium]
MKEIYQVATRPIALDANIVAGEKYRITVLTEGLVRLEYSEDGVFEDRATQMAFYRDFPSSDYRVVRTEDGIEIHTSRIHLIYNEKEFTSFGLSIQVKGNLSAYHSIWHYGEEVHDLGGTARTLDLADGAIPLEHGVVSRFGYSVLDDSRSQVLLQDGWIEPRKKGIQDLYFFGYGHDYKEALRDFYYMCGKTPMLPRYALGNWWSRYYKYTEESYLELMDRFEQENLPFTVAVIDMDWHLVDIDPKYGSGWTGYTWNRELFPDPARFLKELHRRGMHTTLNVHPAEGVKAHEEMYEEMAKELGVDYEHEDPINCDAASPAFLEAYFKYLHHPREEEGVDFWWIDWQQGSNSKIEGLDPLWILNHFHFLDSRRNGKRPMTFSRYAGPGSHRYPVGFSGDTVITWESLDFQPYFTATASNVGYGWWSHDIGGHMLGYKDDEMAARWVQFGIYSPIMRLHSSSSEFNGKEPWRFKKESELAMDEALRERHRMMPYLYTMNYRSYQENLPVVMPMYYEYPEAGEAYEVRNQFCFGNELIVAPVTAPRISGINAAKVKVWLPEGIWYDIHTGMMYSGGRTLDMYRMLSEIPVLAKAGSILPFTDEISGIQADRNPDSFRIQVFAGSNGSFTLYEDDNETCDYEKGICVLTDLEYVEDAAENKFVIHPSQGALNLIPEKRSYVIELVGYRKTQQIQVLVDDRHVEAGTEYCESRQAWILTIPETAVTKKIQVCLAAPEPVRENKAEERCFDFLNQAEIGFVLKDQIYGLIRKRSSIPVLIGELNAMRLDADLYGALLEILTARND